MIGIIGTGWLGKPLAEALIAEKHRVKGTTTSPERIPLLEDASIIPYVLALTESGPEGAIVDFLQHCTTLIINIPPGLRRNPSSNYVKKITHLIPYIEKSSVKNILYISSTSVFANLEGFPLITASTPPNATSNAGKQLITTEKLLQNTPNCKTTILRFAGLFGKDRHPAYMLSKKSGIKNPDAPVNLIHLEDCIGIILKIIATKSWGHIFNASYPEHPSKKNYYDTICKNLQLPPVDYNITDPSVGKLITSTKITTQLSYSFSYGINYG